MKEFEEMKIREARVYAESGGQALHLFSHPGIYPGAPQCFKRVDIAAHLFDQDVERLKETVRKLGVRVIVVSCSGTMNQHVDLCGKPLEKARKMCDE